MSMSSGLTSSSIPISGSSSRTSSSSSASISYAPLSPCPTSSSYYCLGENQQTTCSSNGNNYAIQCGIVYEGAEIDTSDINEVISSLSSTIAVSSASAAAVGVFSRTRAAVSTSSAAMTVLSSTTGAAISTSSATEIDESDESDESGMSGSGSSIPIESDDAVDGDDMSEMAGMSMLGKRATVPDVQSCRNLCDRTAGCKAFNFVGNDCTLFSSVTGYSYAPGAVSGTVYGQGEAPPTPIDTSPVCPASAGRSFTDGMNVTYDIVCYTQYNGSYVDTAPFNSNNLANCLPACDRNELCAGVAYDTSTSQCTLISAFDDPQVGNNNFIAAIRVGGAPAYSASASSSIPPATVTTTLGPSTIICKLVLTCPSGATSANLPQHILQVQLSPLPTRLSTL